MQFQHHFVDWLEICSALEQDSLVKLPGVNALVLEVDEIHLLSDLLQGHLRAKGSEISSHVSVSLGGDLLQVKIVSELHVLGVNPENLKTTNSVWDPDVNLTVESSEPPEGGVDGVRPIGGGHHDHVGPLLQTVHQGQQLGHDPPLFLKY